MKPLAQEEDVLVFLEPGGKRKYYYVYQTEDVVYVDNSNWCGITSAVSTNTLGTSVQLTELEPNEKSEPEVEIYQVRCGVRGPCMVYVELMAGTHRRGTWNEPRPTSDNYYIGHLDAQQSPSEDPRFEMFLKHGLYPAFAVYNPTTLRKAECELHFIGKKLRCFDLEKDIAGKVGVDTRVLKELLARVKAGTWPHRAITPRGLEV